MPHEIAIPAIETALRALLVSYAPFTSLLASKSTAQGGGPAIYNDGKVPQGATMPYLVIGAWTQIGSHALGHQDAAKYGWNCTGMLKAVGQSSETALLTLMSKVFNVCYQGRPLTVDGYGSAWCDEFQLQPTLVSNVAGVVTFEVPAILRVYVYDLGEVAGSP